MNGALHTLRDAHNTGQLATSCPATAGLLAWLALSAAMQPADRLTPSPAPAPPDRRPAPDRRPSADRPPSADRSPAPGPGAGPSAPVRMRPAGPARTGVNR